MSDLNDDILEKTGVEVDAKTDEPPMYKVVVHNDDYTPKEFVVELLVYLFHKSSDEATALILNSRANVTRQAA
jgi:ATP-dependent Clp protease adaptor protein ClpS